MSLNLASRCRMVATDPGGVGRRTVSHFRHRDNGWHVSMASDRAEGFCVTELSGNDIESNDRSQLGLRAKR
jgi:hypothetical protein